MKISSGVLDRNLDVDPHTAALGFRVQLAMESDTVRTGDETSTEKKEVRVLVRWLKGTDSVLFESFCGMLKRKLEGR